MVSANGYSDRKTGVWKHALFSLAFSTGAKNAASLMEGDSLVGRALLDCRGRGSESHSLSFFYSRIECWREKRIALYGRMSSEERKEKCYYGKTSKDEL